MTMYLKIKYKKIISLVLAVTLILTLNIQPVQAQNTVTAPSELASHHAYTVIDARTGETIVSDQKDKKVYPASTTKLMTAIVVLENASTNKSIKVTPGMIKAVKSGCSSYGIKAGERYKVGTLLNMLLICSAGDAAICLAVGVFGSVDKCVAAMNRKCKTLGLSGTSFDNPIGLDIGNGYKKTYTTASDMAQITRYAMSKAPIKTIVARKRFVVHQTNGRKGKTIKSTNHFYSDVSYSRNMYTIIGTKTGTTKAAGAVFTATAVDKSGREVICVYMGKSSTKDTFNDIRKLLDTVYTAQKTDKISLSTGQQEICVESQQLEKEFEQNETFNLNVTIKDKDSLAELGSNAGMITYTSTDESVATVDESGNVTMVGEGTADIQISVSRTAYHRAARKTVTLSLTQMMEDAEDAAA